MASGSQGSTMELLSRSEAEESANSANDKEHPADQQTSSRSSDTSRRQESPVQTVQKLPLQNGIPPKRLSIMSKRKPPATPTGPSKPATLTTPRVNPGTGLSKPPTRPFPSSSARRPAASAPAVTAASSSHKKRPSVSSTDNKRKGDDSALEENVKASLNQSENRGSKPDPRKAATNSSSTSYRSPLALSTNKDRGISSTSQDSGSPTKATHRSATNGLRSSITQTASKTTRPPSLSTRAAIGPSAPDTRKKRLSTIPASPVLLQTESTPSQPVLSHSTPVKPARPCLGTRNSTMSVTIEQRLREMELVHQMLHVAMAEDGDESDEVKEEYGKRVDESLASLRSKLQEARRNEGLDAGEVNKDNSIESQDTLTSNGGIDRSTSDLDKLQTVLAESQTKTSTLETELAVLQSKVLHRHVHPEEALEHITETTQRLRNHQEDVGRVRMDHISKIDDLEARHKADLAAAHSRLDEAENKHKDHLAQSIKNLEKVKRVAILHNEEKTKDALGSQLQKHASDLEGLERQLANERTGGLEAASSIRELQSEISTLQTLLSEGRQMSADATQRADQQRADIFEEKEHLIIEKDERILDLQQKILDLQTTKSRELEDAKAVALEQEGSMESELISLREKLREYEANQESFSAAHERILGEKDGQIDGLGQAIEHLQSKLQHIHETKARDVDKAKLELIGEHDRLISDLRRTHREEIDAMMLTHGYELETRHKEQLGYTAENDKTVTELRDLLRLSESALEGAKIENADNFETVDTLKMRIHSLELEGEDFRAAKTSTNDALQQASNEILSLKKTLETIGNEDQSKNEQHMMAVKKIKDELEATSRTLKENSFKEQSVKEMHAKVLQSLREKHVEDIEALKKKTDETIQDLQQGYDELLASWNQAEKEHPVELKNVATEHKVALDRHAQDLDNLKVAHSKETEELKAQFERHRAQDRQSSIESHAEKAIKSEKKYLRDINELQQLHEGRYISLRNELEDAENEKSLAAQKAHATALADLQSQLEAEALKLEEFRSQLANAQVEASQATEKVAGLAAALEKANTSLLDTTESDRLRQEIVELTKQHEHEHSNIQENLVLENEKREKERKQGAEVRDRLVAESERIRIELLAANDKTKEQQKLMNVSANKAQEANRKLSAVCQAADRHKVENRKVLEELQSTRDELEKMKSERSETKTEEFRDISQQLEALKTAAEAGRQKCVKLEEQLHEAQAVSEKHAIRVREVECALKVTTAELVELQTERPNGTAFSASPAPKSGLRSSRWGVLDHMDEEDDSGVRQNLEFGSHIEGNQMAGIKEQVRQLDGLNEDMIEEAQRFLSRMSRMTSLLPTTGLVPLDEVEEEEIL